MKEKKIKFEYIVIYFIAIIVVSILLGNTLSMCIGNLIDKSQKINFFTNLLNKNTYIIALFLIAIFIGITIYFTIKYKMYNNTKIVNRVDRAKSNAHGNADFMSLAEMNKEYGCGLTPYSLRNIYEEKFNGFIINSFIKNGEYYFHAVEKKHGCIVGTNGTGKSLYFLGPTIQALALSNHKPSLIINDMKGELEQTHSLALQKNGYNVKVLNFRDPTSSLRFNPLSLIWDAWYDFNKYPEHERDYNLLSYVSSSIIDISETIVPPGTGESAQWNQASQGIIAGLLWAMLEDSLIPEYKMTKDKFTLAQLSNILNKQKDNLEDFLIARPKTSRVLDHASMIVGNKAKQSLSSYIANTQTNLKPFLEEGVKFMTSASDIDLNELIEKPTAIFMIVPDENKSRYALVKLVIANIYNHLIFKASSMPKQTLDNSVYFLLDEFGNLPQLPSFTNWISISRSRNIFFLIIIQAFSQLKSIYGEHDTDTILQNCHFQMFLGANELQTLEQFQKMLGTYTIYNRNVNLSTEQVNAGTFSNSLSLSEKKLVELDELQNMEKGSAYFTMQGKKPSKATYVIVYDELLKDYYTFGSCYKPEPFRGINEAMNFYDIKKRNQVYALSSVTEDEGFADPDTGEILTPTQMIERAKQAKASIKLTSNFDDDNDDDNMEGFL